MGIFNPANNYQSTLEESADVQSFDFQPIYQAMESFPNQHAPTNIKEPGQSR